MQKRMNPVAVVVLGVALVSAVASWSRAEDKEAAPGGAPPAGRMGGGMGMGMGPGSGMGRMGMHGHMMGGGGMMGGCPMMGGDVAVKVDKTKNGATLTFTSDDPKVVRRIQIRAEILRLMNELHSGDGATEKE